MNTQIWKWILLGSCMAIMSCSTTTLSERSHQIDVLVSTAENQMDSIQINFINQQFSALNNGISFPFLSNKQLLPWENMDSITKSNAYYSTVSKSFNTLDLSQSQKNELDEAFEHYQFKSTTWISEASENYNFCNDSIQRFICHENLRLTNKIITQSDYDHQMTKIQETFLPYLRSMMEEDKIRIQLSIHYRVLQNDIQRILTEKQWEVYFSCVYAK